MVRGILGGAGRLLLAFGLVVLLFAAYQLWGTGISTRIHQGQLREQFRHEVALLHGHGIRPVPTTASAGPGGTTTSTEVTNGVQPPVPGVAPREGQAIGTIDIPEIGTHFVVVEGTSIDDLKLGPGHYSGTPLPGQPGNAAIAGHRTTYLAPFFNLDRLAPGNPIFVDTTQGHFHYEVSRVLVVDPGDVSVLRSGADPELTLTTCNPRFSAAQRLVVQASLVTPPAPVPAVAAGDHGSRRAPSGLDGAGGTASGAIGWGAGLVTSAVVVWLVARRPARRSYRVILYAAGTLPLLVLLFLFFQSVNPLLPSSF